MIYFAYFHSVVNYCIIFWGNSTYSNKIFIVLKKGSKNNYRLRESRLSREVFKVLNILTLTSQYVVYAVSYVLLSRISIFLVWRSYVPLNLNSTSFLPLRQLTGLLLRWYSCTIIQESRCPLYTTCPTFCLSFTCFHPFVLCFSVRPAVVPSFFSYFLSQIASVSGVFRCVLLAWVSLLVLYTPLFSFFLFRSRLLFWWGLRGASCTVYWRLLLLHISFSHIRGPATLCFVRA